MRQPKHPIQLSAHERAELEGIVRTGQHKARIIRRAQTLLWSDAGKSDGSHSSPLPQSTPVKIYLIVLSSRFA